MTAHEPMSAARRLVRRRVAGVALMLCLLGLAGLAGYRLAERAALRDLRADTGHQLDLMAAAVDREVTRHAHIPGAVGLNPEVLALLRRPAARDALQGPANRYLERLNAHIDGLAVFVLDLDGVVVASSDWIYSDNVLGADFSYRPFFRAAAGGTPYRQYGVDAIRNEPGYFFAHPIRDESQEWRVIGVAVVKSGIASLERRWLAQEVSTGPALIADGNGVVLLASPASWKYATLKPLSGEVIAEIGRHQFDGRAPGGLTLDVDVEAASVGTPVRLPSPGGGPEAPAALGGHDYLAFSRHLPESAWRLLVFANLRPVRAQALTAGALAAAVAGCLLLGFLYVRQRRRALRAQLESQALLQRANQALERKVAERTADLSDAVSRLEAEVGERKRAVLELRAAQDELIQAAKLAVLGQLATGITHELNQPLGAVRTLSGNAIEFMKRGNLETAESNLRIVGQLAEQMGAIITPLKTFARKSPAVSSAVDVAHAVASALFLFDQRLQRCGVSVDNRCRAGELIAWCDPNRLQQVLVNLVGNAIDAMLVQPVRRLTVEAWRQADGRIALSVGDTGGGFSPAVRERLFEPFFTTKPAGEGLGLGLVISRDIVRDFGGDLSAESPPGGGARFVIHLPAGAGDATGSARPDQGAFPT